MTKLFRIPPERAPAPEARVGRPLPADAGPFGHDTDPEDSARLQRLREIIDSELGWATPEDEEDGDYERRLKQVAKEIAALHVREDRLRTRIRGLLARIEAALG